MLIEPITLVAALLAGLLGSGHCLGMCGPIAALAGRSGNRKPFGRSLLYNAGRLISYASIGALFGGLGYAFGTAAQVTQWSLILRVGLGVVLVMIGLQLALPRLRANPLTRLMEKLGARFWRWIAPLAQRLRPAENGRHLFALGLLWGWLPCGLVYSMLALAAVSGSAANGAATMIAFGVGTLPAMVGVGVASGIAGSGLSALRRPVVRRLLGAAVIVSGIWIAAMPMQHALMNSTGTHHHAALGQMPTP